MLLENLIFRDLKKWLTKSIKVKDNTMQTKHPIILWDHYYFDIENSTLTKALIAKSVNSFWKEISKIIYSDQHLISLFRFKTNENIILTLGQLQKLSIEDKDYYINYIYDVLSFKGEDYKDKIITQIIFNYGTRSGSTEKNILLKDVIKNTDYQNYKHYKLPITVDPLDYGKILYYDKKNNTSVVQVGQLTQAIITNLFKTQLFQP